MGSKIHGSREGDKGVTSYADVCRFYLCDKFEAMPLPGLRGRSAPGAAGAAGRFRAAIRADKSHGLVSVNNYLDIFVDLKSTAMRQLK
jgi:hypothetical protein